MPDAPASIGSNGLRGFTCSTVQSSPSPFAPDGAGNVRQVDSGAGRLLVGVADAARVDYRALQALGARGVARPSASSVQVILPHAAEIARELTPRAR